MPDARGLDRRPVEPSSSPDPLRICLLTDEEPEDFDPSGYLRGYDWTMVTVTAPAAEQIVALAERREFDVFLNLCEGYEPEDLGRDPRAYHALEVVKALEAAGVPFTGADSRCFDPSREEMQAVAEAHGLGFAPGYHVRGVEEALQLVKQLRFPIMVKHPRSYGSIGMFPESRAESLEQVEQQVARNCSLFGAARMEQFIVGREYNVLIVENGDDPGQPFAYPPAELVFPPGEEFWHTGIKWNYNVPFAFKEVVDCPLRARLQEAGRRMFLAMGLSGYGRCDIRIDEHGGLYILEINPNPAIMLRLEEYGPADYMILYDGDGYPGFLDRVFGAAFARQRRRKQPADASTLLA
jgi:D-alanine-D-alanine ligase